ncbi:hypothetical protein JAAARDRAFT_107947, partial [Jaapia argillacea MUCL 33604]
QADYLSWCTKNNFTSMLREDVEARKAKADLGKTQGTLDGHLCTKDPQERIIPYSNDSFKSAAIQWLVETDQPISALEHPSFAKMIDIASRAKNGVKI